MSQAHESSAKNQPPLCPSCGQPMTFVRNVPRLGPLPELRTFHCLTCGEVATIPVED